MISGGGMLYVHQYDLEAVFGALVDAKMIATDVRETLMEFYKDPNGMEISARCEVLYNGSPIDTLASHCGYNEKKGHNEEQMRVCNTLW